MNSGTATPRHQPNYGAGALGRELLRHPITTPALTEAVTPEQRSALQRLCITGCFSTMYARPLDSAALAISIRARFVDRARRELGVIVSPEQVHVAPTPFPVSDLAVEPHWV